MEAWAKGTQMDMPTRTRESEKGRLSTKRVGCGSQRKGGVVLCKTKQEIFNSEQLNDKQGH